MKHLIKLSFAALLLITLITQGKAQFKQNNFGPFRIVTADALNVRSKATLGAKVIDQINLNKEVIVLEESKTVHTDNGRTLPFVKIQYLSDKSKKEKIGYVWSGFLTQAYLNEGPHTYFLKYEKIHRATKMPALATYSLFKIYKGEVRKIRELDIEEGFELEIYTQGNLGLKNTRKAIVVNAYDSGCCSNEGQIIFCTLEDYKFDYQVLPSVSSQFEGDEYYQLAYLFPNDAMGEAGKINLAKLSFGYENHYAEPTLEKLKTYEWDGMQIIDLDRVVAAN